MIVPIVAYGDPVLRKIGKEIDKDYPDLEKLIENMKDTMKMLVVLGWLLLKLVKQSVYF